MEQTSLKFGDDGGEREGDGEEQQKKEHLVYLWVEADISPSPKHRDRG